MDPIPEKSRHDPLEAAKDKIGFDVRLDLNVGQIGYCFSQFVFCSVQLMLSLSSCMHSDQNSGS